MSNTASNEMERPWALTATTSADQPYLEVVLALQRGHGGY